MAYYMKYKGFEQGGFLEIEFTKTYLRLIIQLYNKKTSKQVLKFRG